jgi:hypothetical protein
MCSLTGYPLEAGVVARLHLTDGTTFAGVCRQDVRVVKPEHQQPITMTKGLQRSAIQISRGARVRAVQEAR